MHSDRKRVSTSPKRVVPVLPCSWLLSVQRMSMVASSRRECLLVVVQYRGRAPLELAGAKQWQLQLAARDSGLECKTEPFTCLPLSRSLLEA